MKPKLYIKGMKEPIELEKEEADEAQKLINDVKRDFKTPFAIENVWSGTKGDMRYVSFPKKFNNGLESEFTKPDVLTKEELVSLEKELEPFNARSKALFNTSGYGQLLWMESKGVIKLRIVEVAKDKKYPEIEQFESKFSERNNLEEKLKQYNEVVSKREFVEKKKLESLKQLAVGLEESKKVV